MNLERQRILITGAGGGIGAALCAQLVERKARLCLVDRNPDAAEAIQRRLHDSGAEIRVVPADITRPDERARAVDVTLEVWNGVDVLINLAGLLNFTRFDAQNPDDIQRMLQVNIEAPLQLTRRLLPQMLERGQGRIVNVGSMFGSIGFPCFATYSATKFALRGFSQALRRELAGSGVGVTYVSPRAVRTPFNPPVVHHMAEIGLMHMDDPAPVARRIVGGIEKDRDEVYIGFPESLFARLNAILPGLVGRAIARQVPVLRSYAKEQAGA